MGGRDGGVATEGHTSIVLEISGHNVEAGCIYIVLSL